MRLSEALVPARISLSPPEVKSAARVAAPSMDLPEFLAELQSLDAATLASRPRIPRAQPLLDDPRDIAFRTVGREGEPFHPSNAPERPRKKPAPSSSGTHPLAGLAVAAIGLLLAMLLGGGAAAFLFHTRIAALLR